MKRDYSDNTKDCGVEELAGKTIVELDDSANGDLRFTMDDGSVYEMGYIPDCCATCDIESGLEDLQAMVGQKLVSVSMDTSSERPADVAKPEHEPESQTWTFYTFRSNEATAQLRWFGESNGYYSESVTFRRMADAAIKAASDGPASKPLVVGHDALTDAQRREVRKMLVEALESMRLEIDQGTVRIAYDHAACDPELRAADIVAAAVRGGK